MQAQKRRREALDLIALWGDAAGQAELGDPGAGEGTSAANVSMLPLSSPSQRLVQIRRPKKCTCDEMFSELMQSFRTERAQQNAWRQKMAEFRKAENEREERRWEQEQRRWEQEERWQQRVGRRQDEMLRLMQEQTDLLRRLVELQERQQEQSLYNHPPSSPSSISSSP
ncbi:trichohyalin-like [Malaclemys terrapin pileata]|uniref:trichohyalin-like n=1 Tax=Malaclemys terrapin pileata TaxID=2991368 RepID=UPI0023A908FF|nr:trichohyalin-like [Malaclemys terrapin pileata]